MKVALVHDDLIQFGGAESVLLAFHKIWPDAPVYTSVVSDKWKRVCDKEDIEVIPSYMQKLPFVQKAYRYYAPFLLHQLAFESFDFSGFDVVVSSSSRFAHSIITKPHTKHICYIHSPGRMIWEPDEYFSRETYGLLSPIKFLANAFLSLPLSLLKVGDYVSAQRVDYFVTNGRVSQRRVKKYFNRDSKIIHPPVDCSNFINDSRGEGSYFLVVTRLAPWKNVDIAVEACSRLGEKLKVVGEGPDRKRLESMAGSSVKFLGHVTDGEKRELYAGCRALLYTQKEDFGIVPLEAMASGKPVIAYGKGGVLESVVPGETGEFFKHQSVDSLAELLKEFDEEKYDYKECERQAWRFDISNFEREVKKFVNNVYLKR